MTIPPRAEALPEIYISFLDADEIMCVLEYIYGWRSVRCVEGIGVQMAIMIDTWMLAPVHA